MFSYFDARSLTCHMSTNHIGGNVSPTIDSHEQVQVRASLPTDRHNRLNLFHGPVRALTDPKLQ